MQQLDCHAPVVLLCYPTAADRPTSDVTDRRLTFIEIAEHPDNRSTDFFSRVLMNGQENPILTQQSSELE